MNRRYTKDDAYKALNNLKKEYVYEVAEVDRYQKEVDEYKKVYDSLLSIKKDHLSTGIFSACFWGINMLWGLFSVVPLVIFTFLTGRSIYNTVSKQQRLNKATTDCKRYLDMVENLYNGFNNSVKAMTKDIDMLQDVVYSSKGITSEHEEIIDEWLDNIVGEFDTEVEKSAYLAVRDFRKSYQSKEDEKSL